MPPRPEHDGVFFPLPSLPTLPDDSMRELFVGVGRDAETKYYETRDQLLKLLTTNDAVQILASLAHFFVLTKTPGRIKRDDHKEEIEQHHLELAQAFALTRPLAKDPPKGQLAHRVQETIELLLTHSEAALLRRLAVMPTSPGERKRAFVLEQIRGHTQVVRGALYVDQIYRYLQLTLERLDGGFAALYGLTASTVLQVLRALIQLIEERLNELAVRQARFFRKRETGEVAREFVEAFPEFGVDKDEVLTRFTRASISPDHLRHMLVDITCVLLPECFTIGHADIENICPPNSTSSAIAGVIKQWSLSFNDLATHNLEHIYLDNPVWQRPFIRLDDGRFFWPTPNISLTFAFEMFELLIKPHKHLSDLYHDTRAEMLENELGILLTHNFPRGKVMQRLKWTMPAEPVVYENDAVVVIDRTVLIFEAKSRRVKASALRGSPASLPEEIHRIMVEPAAQSKRLMDVLSIERRIHCFDSKNGPVEIDSRTIDNFTRINISFEPIGDLTSRWPDLVDRL